MKFDVNSIIEKFRYAPNSVKKNYDGRTDVYLAKVSYRYAYFKRIACVFLVLILVAFLLSGNLSYNKVYYLVKDIKLAGDYVSSVHDTITYNVGNSQSFSMYRGGLAVSSRERMSIFSAGGRELFSSNHSYGNPALVSGDKYVLLYDVGGKQFSLYNSFSTVTQGELDYSIYGADISDSGDFALISKSEKYNSVVRVYKQNGTKYDYNFSSGLVSSVSLSSDGSKMAVLLVYAEGDELNLRIRLYKVGSDDYKEKEITFCGIPYAVKILDGGNVCAIGAKGVNTFNSNLGLIGEYLTEKEIYLYTFGEDNIAVSHLTDDGAKTDVVCLNKRGRIEKEYVFDERILDVALSDGCVFVHKLGGFERINIALGTRTEISMVATDFEILSCDKNTLVICNSSYARFLSFER